MVRIRVVERERDRLFQEDTVSNSAGGARGNEREHGMYESYKDMKVQGG